MKLRTTIAVAALTLTTASIVTPADAFGIIIRFGGFRVHHSRVHAARPHRDRRAVARRERGGSNKDTNVARNKNGAVVVTDKDGQKIYIYGPSPKQPLPMVIKRPAVSQQVVDWVMPTYASLPKKLTDAAGPMVFYVSSTIGEFRKFSQLYDAPDGMDGKAFVDYETKGPVNGACKISLITANMPDDGYMAYVMTHKLAHCVDFREGVTRRDDFLRAFYSDLKDDAIKEQIIAHGLGHYTNPQRGVGRGSRSTADRRAGRVA